MDYYNDIMYSKPLSKKAAKDLNILFFDSFFKKSEKILDVGCSVGRIMDINPKKFIGIDFDKKALKMAKQKGLSVKYADFSKKIPFRNEEIGSVFCSQVIEHLKNPLSFLKEIHRILKKGGNAVIITQDYTISSKKRKSNFWDDYTHVRPFTQESLKRVAYDAGFRKFRVYHFPGKISRTLLRNKIISKEQWIKLEKFPFMGKGQDIILEAIKT